MDYTSKNIIIVNYKIVAAEAWEQALDISSISAPKSIRKWWIKSRENVDIDTAFDYNFASIIPSTYGTNGGQGFSMDNTALSNLWVKARHVDTVIEIVYFG